MRYNTILELSDTNILFVCTYYICIHICVNIYIHIYSKPISTVRHHANGTNFRPFKPSANFS